MCYCVLTVFSIINCIFQNVLRDEIKDKFKYEVDRSSPSNKIRDFMDWASDIIHDIQYQRKIHSYPLARLLIKLW